MLGDDMMFMKIAMLKVEAMTGGAVLDQELKW